MGACVVVVGVGVGGGGGSEGLTKAEFIKRGDAICGRFQSECEEHIVKLVELVKESWVCGAVVALEFWGP